MGYLLISGPGDASAAEADASSAAGRWAAEHGHVVVCGGLGGVMAAGARGAAEAGGVVVGLLPGSDRADGNAWLTVAIPTGLGEMRNALLVRAADVVLCVGGSWGTLSELALAVRTGVPVVALGTWPVAEPAAVPDAPGLTVAHSLDEALRAVGAAFARLSGGATDAAPTTGTPPPTGRPSR
ncbi:TIGR00725 family protein [Actinotalea solisilvae]|uniref:TIGR00725 family protein n=1 Tax=Actinotalea solisilvae TaxID=2072922 RepID=UPI0018F17235|nr:TIGR00725 family protein [Actinotalea solisilvae]